MEDLIPRLDEPAIRQLLGLAVYPDPIRLQQVCERYRREPHWSLWGFEHDGTIVGCIGLELGEDGHAVIRQIAVLPEAQRGGVGRTMLRAAHQRHRFTHVEAETHKDAVEFYRRCGFTVSSLGELYPNVERFRCVWEAPPGGASAAFT